ncbi:MAG: hypothetical protein KAV82_03355 [Phycisphaerae bacterium]|nr:hypothetical protein [Phycisphaerae bacterium]
MFFVVPVFADDPPGDLADPTPIKGVKQVFMDAADDMALHRTDADPSVDPVIGNWPELDYATLGRWAPTDAFADPYFGNYSTNGGFFRLDMVFCELLNPLGDVNGLYDPIQYGINPVFYWVEFDMDANEETGGDTEEPHLGYDDNIARWGGIPQGERFRDRINTDGEPWSGDFNAVPATHRSGQEFALFCQGDHFYNIDRIEGDADEIFEAGETWIVGGDFFWRARGYDPITYSTLYRPYITVRFKHSIADDVTTVSFVYPLDNDAHAELYGEPPEGIDFFAGNANSIHEAMYDLNLSAGDPPPGTSYHTYRPLLAQWEDQDPLDHLDPWNWRCTMLFGTALDEVAQGGKIVAWTDAWPDIAPGDFNGDGLVSKTDRQMLSSYIVAHDGELGYDADEEINNQIDRASFSDRFSVHDIDYDGLVSISGFPEQDPCDYDNDGDVDLEDYQAFQKCYSTQPLNPEVLANVGCIDAFDDNGDLDVDLGDYTVFVSVLNNP